MCLSESRGDHNSAVSYAPNDGLREYGDGNPWINELRIPESGNSELRGEHSNDEPGMPYNDGPSTHESNPGIQGSSTSAAVHIAPPTRGIENNSTVQAGSQPLELTETLDTSPARDTNGSLSNHASNDNAPHIPPLQNNRQFRKTTQAALKIATLNMRGRGSIQKQNKWNHINQIVRENI